MRAGGDGAVREAEGVTVGFYAPMPPARTGVADYAAALEAELRRHGRVKMAPGVPPGPCDVTLYHLGNNALHAEIYRRALERPGVVTLHDAVLHHFLLGQLDEAGYIGEFVYNYGEWNRGLAREMWRGRAASATDSRYFRYALLRRVAERARAVVVHNPAAARAVKEHAPEARVVEIPHLFQAPAPAGEEEVARYRRRLGIEPGRSCLECSDICGNPSDCPRCWKRSRTCIERTRGRRCWWRDNSSRRTWNGRWNRS